MRNAVSGGPGLSFVRVDVEGRQTAEAAPFLGALPVQPANLNAALNSLAPVRQAARRTRIGPYAALGKRGLDLLFVLLSLPVVLPLIALCAAALWLEGGRPFYTQARLGRGGQLFRILKLRTMVRDADQLLQHYLKTDPELRREWDETQKLKNDPRITRVGRFLRATSLDELPQLWNVACGEMSLVGPRPMMPEQLPLYGDARAYFALRPGITGVWQVSVRNEGSFASRAQADAEYRQGLSLGSDLALIWRTAGVVLKGTGY
ncbi:sugar transferase [Leisingera daeponensis]|uniref:Sugar transferase n=1 Tax=Leisingera daeponensis TaxID=405746 RepID=A0ABS7NL68_9RHOB|nr:sugar transferase [Leisingera daeponensis]MBY6140886.1 sugar transferase [Leisingera daeponensis]